MAMYNISRFLRISTSGHRPTASAPVEGRASAISMEKAARDPHDQGDDEHFDIAKATVLHVEHDQDIERREADTPDERKAKQEL